MKILIYNHFHIQSTISLFNVYISIGFDDSFETGIRKKFDILEITLYGFYVSILYKRRTKCQYSIGNIFKKESKLMNKLTKRK
jgi:hypothetical protein